MTYALRFVMAVVIVMLVVFTTCLLMEVLG